MLYAGAACCAPTATKRREVSRFYSAKVFLHHASKRGRGMPRPYNDQTGESTTFDPANVRNFVSFVFATRIKRDFSGAAKKVDICN